MRSMTRTAFAAVVRRLAPWSVVAWIVTLVVASTGATAAAYARNPASAPEMALLFAPLMSVPFALSTAFVLLPLVSLVAANDGRAWLAGAAGLAAAPLQVLALLAAGRVWFRGSGHMRPTLADDVAAVLGHPSAATLAILLGFALGGLTLAWLASRATRVDPLTALRSE